jgi:DNA-binding PadR family transcriptional regulator
MHTRPSHVPTHNERVALAKLRTYGELTARQLESTGHQALRKMIVRGWLERGEAVGTYRITGAGDAALRAQLPIDRKYCLSSAAETKMAEHWVSEESLRKAEKEVVDLESQVQKASPAERPAWQGRLVRARQYLDLLKKGRLWTSSSGPDRIPTD